MFPGVVHPASQDSWAEVGVYHGGLKSTCIRLFAVGLTLTLSAPFLSAQELEVPNGPRFGYWSAHGYLGSSAKILGTSDIRQGGGLGISFAYPANWLLIKPYRTEMVFEAYTMYTQSTGVVNFGASPTWSLGGLAYARYSGPHTDHVQPYVEIGWGLNYSTARTRDLDSTFNSTPMIGAGIRIPDRNTEWMIGIRLLHLSNGGTYGSNRGQNYLLFHASVRI